MVSRELLVKKPGGLHARPAALFVQKANEFRSSIYLELEGKKADAKSIIGIMSLGVYEGERVRLSADGPDENQALESLGEFLEDQVRDL